MDVQGPTVVAPWVKRYGVTFPVAVDTADVVGSAFGLKAIPVSFLVDEVGIIRLQGSGPSKEFLAQVQEILRQPVSGVRSRLPESAAAMSLAQLRTLTTEHPADPDAHLALARLLERAGNYAAAITECEAAARLRPVDATIPFTQGLVLLRQARTNDALAQFTRARDLDPGNWRIRKQIWALEHPDKFYGSEGIDWSWQKEQIAREKK